MSEAQIKPLCLKNNLLIHFHDRSKKIAGDRWHVSLVARIEIPIQESDFTHISQEKIDITDIKRQLGDQVVFEQKREKVFVGENEKDSLIKKMIDTFRLDMVPYLSRMDFPGKYVVREYRKSLIAKNRPKPD